MEKMNREGCRREKGSQPGWSKPVGGVSSVPGGCQRKGNIYVDCLLSGGENRSWKPSGKRSSKGHMTGSRRRRGSKLGHRTESRKGGGMGRSERHRTGSRKGGGRGSNVVYRTGIRM